MNGLPTDTDFKALLGKLVEQICLSVHQGFLALEDGLSVSIEGEFSFDEAENWKAERDFTSSANLFASLVEERITAVTIVHPQGRDGVCFVFSNGAQLVILDSNQHYESFQIQLPDRLVVV